MLMNSIRYLPTHTRPRTLQLLREFQCNTLEIVPLKRTRHEELVVLWSPLPKAPNLPLRYIRDRQLE